MGGQRLQLGINCYQCPSTALHNSHVCMCAPWIGFIECAWPTYSTVCLPFITSRQDSKQKPHFHGGGKLPCVCVCVNIKALQPFPLQKNNVKTKNKKPKLKSLEFCRQSYSDLMSQGRERERSHSNTSDNTSTDVWEASADRVLVFLILIIHCESSNLDREKSGNWTKRAFCLRFLFMIKQNEQMNCRTLYVICCV